MSSSLTDNTTGPAHRQLDGRVERCRTIGRGVLCRAWRRVALVTRTRWVAADRRRARFRSGNRRSTGRTGWRSSNRTCTCTATSDLPPSRTPNPSRPRRPSASRRALEAATHTYTHTYTRATTRVNRRSSYISRRVTALAENCLSFPSIYSWNWLKRSAPRKHASK